MNDQEKADYARAEMPVAAARAYLNTGTAGPLARVTREALEEGTRFEYETGRGAFGSFPVLSADLERLRAHFAALLGAGESEVALTHHTTEGINIVAHGLAWRAGDEIVTTTAEHEGGLLPLYVLKHRLGVVVKVVALGFEDAPDEIVARLAAAIGPRTRLLAISHVNWNTGLRMPVERLAALARERGVSTLVDGAQSVGAIPLDLGRSGVDFYAAPAQKWLCGPEGIGVLYVRAESLALLEPTFCGFFSLPDAASYDLSGYFVPAPGARRFEVGTVYRPAIRAMCANLQWLTERLGFEWIHARVAALAESARAALLAVPEVEMVTRADAGSGLLTFALRGYDPRRVVARLEEQDVVLRNLGHPRALRISTGFYNNHDDIARLVEGLRAIAAADPESLPPPLF